MKYLYDKVSRKIDELMAKSPKAELDMELLKKSLPDKIRMTRMDVSAVVRELEKEGMFNLDGNKLTRKGRRE
jgi:hypothetical protein